ncbi:hypothetical protein ACW9KT_12750 [Hymenobacter sp. HD11105]
MSSPEPTTRTITYRPDLKILIVRWHQDADPEVLQADYHAMLAAAQEHSCSRWLIDVRRREGNNPEISAWASTVFYPLAASRLAPQRLFLAVLTSAYIYNRFREDAEQRQYVDYMLASERPFTTNVFDEEGPATRWLEGC